MGASTKREYELTTVPVGAALLGQVVDFLGRPLGSQQQLGTDVTVQLFNAQPDMDLREQISEGLTTGVKVWALSTPYPCRTHQIHAPDPDHTACLPKPNFHNPHPTA